MVDLKRDMIILVDLELRIASLPILLFLINFRIEFVKRFEI